MPTETISRYVARASSKYESGVSLDATAYICSRHVQNVPRPRCVRPRSARWNAWLWQLASPGTVNPASRFAPSGGPCWTPLKTPSVTSTRTPSRTGPVPVQARSSQYVVVSLTGPSPAQCLQGVRERLDAGQAVRGLGALLRGVRDP